MLTHLNTSPVPAGRVVILGARGFVARALAARLAADGVPWIAISSGDIDLTDASGGQALAARLQNSDTVVMCAALTPEKGRDVGTLMQNLRMAEQVVSALAVQPCAHLIYISSDAVYDSRCEEISESTPAAPGDLYGVMHLSRELALRQAANQKSIPFCVLRPCAIYGAGDTHNSYGPNRFIRTALADGKIKLFGGGEETRDHVFINDIVELIDQVIGCRSVGTLNLVSGECVSFGHLAAEISRLIGGHIEIESLPRSGPVTHRRFVLNSLQQAFPDHIPTVSAAGLAQIIAELNHNPPR